jgi:hypothetical protein
MVLEASGLDRRAILRHHKTTPACPGLKGKVGQGVKKHSKQSRKDSQEADETVRYLLA